MSIATERRQASAVPHQKGQAYTQQFWPRPEDQPNNVDALRIPVAI